MRVVNSNSDTIIVRLVGSKPNGSFITKGVAKDIKDIFLVIRNYSV
jgi:hypothetical protein